MVERDYWLAFSVFSGIGPIKFKKLLNRFGSAQEAWRATNLDLSKVIGEKLTEKFDSFREEFSIENYLKRLKQKDVWFITLQDEEYPELLKKIKNTPFLLYVKGDIEMLKPASQRGEQVQHDNDNKYIAVVGTRKTTSYGREVTKLLVEELANAGFIIVSGLAIGVDAISHKAAIESNSKTIAVLGCGVDCCFPKENLRLYDDIIQKGGTVFSELPLRHAPTKGSFPARNRIIAGLSLGVLVTEGAEDSGSLITADYALSFGRKVFAVPGPITSSLSKGPYKLIQKGAKLVTSAEDIIKSITGTTSTRAIKGGKGIKSIKGETKEEQIIIDLLQNESLHFDEIVRETGLQSSNVGSILSVMEVKGMIKGLDGGLFKIQIDTG